MFKVKKKGIEFLDRSPIKIDKTFQLKINAETFWGILIDHENWKDWFPNFVECYALEKSDTGMNSKRFVNDGNLKVVEQISTCNPPYQWGFDVVEINIPLLSYFTELVTIEKLSDGMISIHWQVGAELKWWARPIQSKLVNDLDKSFEKMIVNLTNLTRINN